jgi:hypothetical protein
VKVEFVTDLHEQLSLALALRGWTKNALVNWIDRRLPYSSRRDITRISSTLFISKALDVISTKTGMTVEALARANFRLVDAFMKVIAKAALNSKPVPTLNLCSMKAAMATISPIKAARISRSIYSA